MQHHARTGTLVSRVGWLWAVGYSLHAVDHVAAPTVDPGLTRLCLRAMRA